MAPEKVLITGVSGLIGSSVYLHMLAQPERYEVYGLGRRKELSERVPEKRQVALPDKRFFLCDVADMEGVQAAVSGMDVVIHMAADPSGRSWESILNNNLIGAYNIYEASRQAGVKRLVAASTIQVSSGHRTQEPYRSLAAGEYEAVAADFKRISVDIPAEPRNLYASSKVWTESLARTYAHEYDISCLCIRIGWVLAADQPRLGASDIWCSQRDIVQLIECCTKAPDTLRFGIYYGMSDNKGCWVDLKNARRDVGFEPKDRTEDILSVKR